MIANIIIVLIGHAIYLTGQFLKLLEKDLLEKGSFSENIYKYRKDQQKKGPDFPSY